MYTKFGGQGCVRKDKEGNYVLTVAYSQDVCFHFVLGDIVRILPSVEEAEELPVNTELEYYLLESDREDYSYIIGNKYKIKVSSDHNVDDVIELINKKFDYIELLLPDVKNMTKSYGELNTHVYPSFEIFEHTIGGSEKYKNGYYAEIREIETNKFVGTINEKPINGKFNRVEESKSLEDELKELALTNTLVNDAINAGLLDYSNLTILKLARGLEREYPNLSYDDGINLIYDNMNIFTEGNIELLCYDGTNIEDVCIKFLSPSKPRKYDTETEAYLAIHDIWLKVLDVMTREDIYVLTDILTNMTLKPEIEVVLNISEHLTDYLDDSIKTISTLLNTFGVPEGYEEKLQNLQDTLDKNLEEDWK